MCTIVGPTEENGTDGHPAALRLSEHLREGVEGGRARYAPSFVSFHVSFNEYGVHDASATSAPSTVEGRK